MYAFLDYELFIAVYTKVNCYLMVTELILLLGHV